MKLFKKERKKLAIEDIDLEKEVDEIREQLLVVLPDTKDYLKGESKEEIDKSFNIIAERVLVQYINRHDPNYP